MKLSIVVPAHNEEAVIETFLLGLSKEFPKAEIIVVCNDCTDRTSEIVNRIKNPKLKRLIIPEKIGKGAAIIRGFKKSTSDYIGFVDADGAFSYEDMKKIIKNLKNYDCVIASKWKDHDFSSVSYPFTRKIAGRIWNFLVKNLLNLDIEDTQAGLKFLKKSVFNSIDKNFICNGFDFDIELLYKINKKGFKIKEIYAPVKSTNRSSFKIIYSFKMLMNLLRLRLKI
jgi:glycosyltransferase involved in cell wall biosynthesis